SSRRRHTRFSRDWSSDVCSSDLWTGWRFKYPACEGFCMDVKRVIEIAHGELGYRETGVNIQKYSPAVPGLEWSQGQPWCATFTCWVFLQAGGKPDKDFPLTASCLQQVAWGRSRD